MVEKNPKHSYNYVAGGVWHNWPIVKWASRAFNQYEYGPSGNYHIALLNFQHSDDERIVNYYSIVTPSLLHGPY